MTEEGALITYDPGLLKSPKSFIATMAHELSHYVILSQPARSDWEEEPMLEEMATDLFAIACGFGLFKLDSATTSSAFQSAYAQGWSVSHSGYISPEFAAFGLALFMRLNDVEQMAASPHVSDINKKRLATALRQVDVAPELLKTAAGN